MTRSKFDDDERRFRGPEDPSVDPQPRRFEKTRESPDGYAEREGLFGGTSPWAADEGDHRNARGDDDRVWAPKHYPGYRENAVHGGAGPSMRGRGPLSYVRSDERISEELNDTLSDDPHVDASDITVQVEAGVVTLTGTVGERWAKHRAEDIAHNCLGVKDIDNRIRVTG